MPALKCPSCGMSDLHAVNVDSVHLDCNHPAQIKREQQQELGCKHCGWTPSLGSSREKVLSVTPADKNV